MSLYESVYNQKFDHGSLLGIYGVFRPLAGGSSKYFSPIRFYQYGIQLLSLSGVDYSKMDKLFKKKDLTKDNNYYEYVRENNPSKRQQLFRKLMKDMHTYDTYRNRIYFIRMGNKLVYQDPEYYIEDVD